MNLFSYRNEHFYYFSFLQVVVILFDGDEGQPFSKGGIFKRFMESKFCSHPGVVKLICEKLFEFAFLSQ